ncbi:MAG TPA: LLM class F420-dependent oxidoreductase [Chloroflexota bacterium]|jgi:F420-dependent oxidoreductase-like protein
MKLGLHMMNMTWPGGPARIGPTLAAMARRAEDAGFDSLSVMDHLFQIPVIGAAEEPLTEAYATLGFLAGVTRRLRLGAVVTGVTYRHPGLLVKAVTTLDVLSGGRAFLGLGAAWFEREHLGLGMPFPPLAERFRRLEETLQIAKQMWSGEVGPYEGRYYRLAETLCSPSPLQRPHPPIMVGGGGETKTLRLVAKYADACNLFAYEGIDVLEHKLDVLREHCAAEGRPYDAVQKTATTRLLVRRDAADGASTPAQAIEALHALAELGFTHAECVVADAHTDGAFDLIGAEVIPAVAAL